MFNSKRIKELEEDFSNEIKQIRKELSDAHDEIWKLKNPPKFKVGDNVMVNLPTIDLLLLRSKPIGIITDFYYNKSHFGEYNKYILLDPFSKLYNVYIAECKKTINVNEHQLSYVQNKRKR